MDLREEFDRLPPDHFDLDPWLYRTYGKQYRVVLDKGATGSSDAPNEFTFTMPHYFIPCASGVRIEQFAPGCRGPKELAILVIDNPELLAKLREYTQEPQWLAQCARGERDHRERVIWPYWIDEDLGCVHSGTLTFPAEDFDQLAAIVKPLRRAAGGSPDGRRES
jgi:hypothetical protein